jgi:hypothetical protein
VSTQFFPLFFWMVVTGVFTQLQHCPISIYFFSYFITFFSVLFITIWAFLSIDFNVTILFCPAKDWKTCSFLEILAFIEVQKAISIKMKNQAYLTMKTVNKNLKCWNTWLHIIRAQLNIKDSNFRKLSPRAFFKNSSSRPSNKGKRDWWRTWNALREGKYKFTYLNCL